MSREERLRSAIWRLNVTAHGPTEIDLAHASFNDGDLLRLSPYLGKNNILTNLNLQSNVFGDDGARALSKALRRNTALTRLDIKDNMVGDDGCMTLISSLKENQTLNTLDISGNQIGDKGIINLSQALSEDDEEENLFLTTLRIGNNKFTSYGGNEILKSFSKKQNQIILLDLNKSKLGPKHGKIIGESLSNNNCLKTLILDFNLLGDLGVKNVVKGIYSNKKKSKLKKLSLVSNNILDDGIGSIIKYCNFTISHLFLSMNKASCSNNDIILDMFDFLITNQKKSSSSSSSSSTSTCSFEEIDLSHNAIDDIETINKLKKIAKKLDFQFFLNGNLGNKSGLYFPNGIVKKFKPKKILKQKIDNLGHQRYIEEIEYEEDNTEKEEELKNEKTYFKLLNRTIEHARILQELRTAQLSKDPFDSKLILSRRQGDQELHRSQQLLLRSKIARRAGKSGIWDGDEDNDWDDDDDK